MLLDAVIGHEVHVHPAGHLLGAVIPSPVWRRCRPRRLSSRAEHPNDCGGTRRERPASWGDDQAKQACQVADLALLEPEEGFEPSTFRLPVETHSSSRCQPGLSWLLRSAA